MAATLFRERGLHGVGVADIMEPPASPMAGSTGSSRTRTLSSRRLSTPRSSTIDGVPPRPSYPSTCRSPTSALPVSAAPSPPLRTTSRGKPRTVRSGHALRTGFRGLAALVATPCRKRTKRSRSGFCDPLSRHSSVRSSWRARSMTKIWPSRFSRQHVLRSVAGRPKLKAWRIPPRFDNHRGVRLRSKWRHFSCCHFTL